MKIFITGLLSLCGWLAFAQTHQPDSIEFDPMHLEEIVVMDEWIHKPSIRQNATEHSLEMKLKQLQGVNLVSRGSFAREAMYRGQTDGRLQVKLNGMRIYSACTDRMDPSTSYVVANNLKSATAESSCESHCGNSGLAGNINLELKGASFAPSNQWHAGLSQQFHSNTSGLVSNLNLEKQFGKLAVRMNGSWQKHQNYRAGGGPEVAHSQNQKQNWALNTAYRLSDKELLRVDMIYDLATNVGYPALPMDVSKARALIAGATYTSHKGLGPFGWYEVKLYHNDIYHEMDDTQREDVYMHMDMPGWSRTTGATLNAHEWLLDNHKLSAAAEYYTNFRRAEMTMYPADSEEPPMFMFTWPDARIHGFAAGITDHWHFGKFHLNTTARIDYETSAILDEFGSRQWEGMGYSMGNRKNYLLPQLKTALSRHINKAHKLTAAISYGQRGPSTSELFGFYLFNAHDAFDYLGNPDLDAEKLYSAELSHEYQVQKLSISSSVFLQHYRDYIFGLTSGYDAMTWGAQGVRVYKNIDQANFYGFELKAAYAPMKKLKTFAKAEYLRGLRDRDINLPLIPPLQGNLGANYFFRSFDFMLQTRLAAEQNQYNTEYGDRYTPGYALVDAAIGYSTKFNKVSIQLEFAANNLLDSYYRDHLNWGGIPSMGRNLVVKIQMGI